MKLKLFVIALFISLGLSSQIRIGQPIDETIYFLNHLIKTKRNWNIEKKYKNGKIEEVIINKRNQYYYEFNLRTDAVERLIVDNNGNYAYSLRQFPELSLDFIKEKFNKAYKSYKVDDFYFTEDFSHFMKLGLIDNYATVMYAKVRMELFPKSMENKILKQKAIAIEKQKEYQKEADYIEKLENDYFDINEFDPKFSKQLLNAVNSNAIMRLYRDVENLNLGEDLKIKEAFTLKLKVRKNRKISYEIDLTSKNNSSSNFSPKHMKTTGYRFPFIKKNYEGKEYQLNRYAQIDVAYDVVVGLLKIKKKKSEIKILTDNKLNNEHRLLIKNYFKDKKKGNYKVHYQFGSINTNEADAIVYWEIDRKKTISKPKAHLFSTKLKKKTYYIDKGDFKEVDTEAVKKDAIKNSKISGTYSKNEHNYVEIIELPYNNIYFNLNLFNGRNIGVLDGIIKLTNKSGVFEKKDFGLCKFNIKINKSSVEVKTIDNGYDCGYGGGIRSDGKFPLKSKGTPKLE